jgi:lambda family phage portal protein
MAAADPSTWLDRVVGYLSPMAGLKRQAARRSLLKLRAYEGASVKDGWIPRRSGASADADHLADSRMLRSRARSLIQNNPYARKALDSLVANIIGEGIVPESRARTKGLRRQIDALWSQWAKQCDADGKLDFDGLTALAYRAMEQDGEVLIRLRPRRPEDGLAVPLQLQVLEIDYLDSLRNNDSTVAGIERDALGRVVAYWLHDRHPGDSTGGLVSALGTGSKRVPADRVIHLYAVERPGQSRGITRFAAAIARLRDLAIYEDAELARKQNESLFSVIVSGDAAEFTIPGAGESLATAQARANQLGDLGELRSGAIFSANGQHVTVAAPAATSGYSETIRSHLYAIAAACGVTYEMLTGDLSQVNFSSSRIGQMEFRRMADQRRWQVLIPVMLERVWSAFVAAAYTSGQIPEEDAAVEWTVPRWQYVQPDKEVKADLDEIRGGLSSISEKLRQRGYQPEAVFRELGEDFAALRKANALEALEFFGGGKSSQPAAAPELPDEDAA